MSTASMQSFKFGCAVRMAHMIEYTSAPLLAANTAIFKVEPKQFTRRHMRSNSARFRRKKVPKDCLLSTWRQTIECQFLRSRDTHIHSVDLLSLLSTVSPY